MKYSFVVDNPKDACGMHVDMKINIMKDCDRYAHIRACVACIKGYKN